MPLPRVDFYAELVLFFTEDSFCNDGTVRACIGGTEALASLALGLMW